MAPRIQRGETEERAGWINAITVCKETGRKDEYINCWTLVPTATEDGETSAGLGLGFYASSVAGNPLIPMKRIQSIRVSRFERPERQPTCPNGQYADKTIGSGRITFF